MADGHCWTWFHKFLQGGILDFDEIRPGDTRSVTTEDRGTKVHILELAVQHSKMRKISKVVEISKELMCFILHEPLGMRKPVARWVRRLFPLDGKCPCETTSEQILPLLCAISRRFCFVLWLSLRPVSTGFHQRPRSAQNSGLRPGTVLQKIQRLSNRLRRWWRWTPRIHKVWSAPTTWKGQIYYRTVQFRVIAPIYLQVVEKGTYL